MNTDETKEQMDEAIIGLALRSLVQEVKALREQVTAMHSKLNEVGAMVNEISWK